MNDYSGLIHRRRRKTLLIVEGNHEKNELFWLIFKCFPELQIEYEDVWIYGTNIYMLYDDIVSEYDEDWDSIDVDLPYVVSKKKTPDNIQRKNDFINVFMVFDYERHDPNFSIEKISRLQEYFSDSTDMGQLYLNYPMIESYQDMPGHSDMIRDFINHQVSVSVRPGSAYKRTIRGSAIAQKTGLPQRIREILNDRFHIQNEEDVELCMLKVLSLNNAATFVNDVFDFLKQFITESDACTAANQFYNLVSKINYMNENTDFWAHMRNEFKKIIQAHICKADRIVDGDDSSFDYENRYENIDYQEILKVQNRVSSDDAIGIIWVLNSSILLVPDYNLNLVKD